MSQAWDETNYRFNYFGILWNDLKFKINVWINYCTDKQIKCESKHDTITALVSVCDDKCCLGVCCCLNTHNMETFQHRSIHYFNIHTTQSYTSEWINDNQRPTNGIQPTTTASKTIIWVQWNWLMLADRSQRCVNDDRKITYAS